MFFKNRDNALKNLPWEPLDIEELHAYATEHGICPYYGNKDRA